MEITESGNPCTGGGRRMDMDSLSTKGVKESSMTKTFLTKLWLRGVWMMTLLGRELTEMDCRTE